MDPDRPAPADQLVFDAPDVRVHKRYQFPTAGERETAPQWRKLGDGLNYWGCCPNAGCRSNVEEVWSVLVPKYFGEFRPREDFDFGRVLCPCCSTEFEPHSFVFYQCDVEVNYRLQGQKAATMKLVSDDENQYDMLGGENVPFARYTSLHIVVRELGHPKKLHGNPEWGPSVVQWMKPANIHYCQDACADTFQCGRKLADTVRALRTKELHISSIPRMSVFRWNDDWFTADNRRLWCFKQAGIKSVEVHVIPVDRVPRKKRSTTNNGVDIIVAAPTRVLAAVPPPRVLAAPSTRSWVDAVMATLEKKASTTKEDT